MVLQIEWNDFLSQREQLHLPQTVFIREVNNGCWLTCGSSEKQLILCCFAVDSAEHLRQKLSTLGYEVVNGEWQTGIKPSAEHETGKPLSVAAIAYRSQSGEPGLWVDAHYACHSEAEALRKMFDELTEDGEIRGISYDDFVELSQANVLLLSEEELRRFAENGEIKKNEA